MKREADEAVKVEVNTPFIKLDSLLKFCGEAETGGMAKEMIQDGRVEVDGEICLQRGRKLYPGSKLRVSGKEYEICYKS